MGAQNLFRSSGPLSTIWRNECRAPKKSVMRTKVSALLPRLPHAGFSLVIMNGAAENDLSPFQVPVHSAREPKTVRSPLAVKTVIELPDGTNEAAHDVHRFRQVNVGFGDDVILFIHPDPPSRFVDEPVFDVPFRQVLFRWLELDRKS